MSGFEEKLQTCCSDLYKFYRLFVTSLYNDNLPAPHIRVLSKELMKLYKTNPYRLCVAMPPRHKLADSTPILTSNRGWTTHGDLKIGDYVYGLNGEPTKIIGISDKSNCNQLITFSNGSKILAHEEHLWTVSKRGNKNPLTITTSEIKKDYQYTEKNGKKRYRYHLPFIKPIQYPKTELPLDPYFLGLWLGDGSSTKPCITHDPKDIESIKHIPYKISTICTHTETGVKTTYFSHQGIIKKIKELHLYNNKHIPRIYLEACVEDRLQLLAGLIDSDGSVDKNGRVRFININKQLIHDVFELCTGLGLYPYFHVRKKEDMNHYKRNSKYNIKSTHDAYVVGFQPKYNIPTQIPRKRINKTPTHRRLAITDITTVKGEQGKCIEIENPDGIYLAGKQLIPTHNSKSSLVTIAYPLWLIFQKPNLNILIVNNEGSLSEKFGIQIREYIRRYGAYFNVYLSETKHSSTHIMFCNQEGEDYTGSIRLTGANGSITGQDADYLIIDDPYKGFEDITPTLLQKKIDWFDTIIEQRIEPHTRFILLHTRWHSNDLQGYFKTNRSMDYHFIEFPAIKPDGTPLWKEKYSIELLEKKRENIGERLFQSIFQQKPIDDSSNFFDLNKFHWGAPPKELTTIQMCRGWDTASSDPGKNDFTAGVPIYLLNDYKSILITDFVHGQFGKDTSQEIKNQIILDGVDNISIIETGVAAAGALLYDNWEQQLPGYLLERAIPVPNNSKADRATPLKDYIYDRHVYVDIQDNKLRKTFQDEFRAFPNGEHDDIVDATAHAFNYINQEFIGNDIFEIVEI